MPADKPKIIFETDIGNDIDDVLAIMMLHTFVSKGVCDLLAISISKNNLYSAIYTDIINTFYKRSVIPIGYAITGISPQDGFFLKQMSERFIKFRKTQKYYKSVSLLRKILAENEDNSISIVSVGLLSNLAELLNSQQDEYSDLTGPELIKRKVKCVYCMGGNFSDEALVSQKDCFAEYNIYEDIKASRCFIDNWPSKIIFAGLEIGAKILFPAQSILEDFKWINEHPGVEAYKIFKQMPYDRPCWDLTAALEAACPQKYFNLSQPGIVRMNANNTLSFQPDKKGNHRYMLLDDKRIDEIKNLFIELCTKPIE
jgi:inosine-uridine nucleoside N-ribohydrolase